MSHATHAAPPAAETFEIPLEHVFCPRCSDELEAAIGRLARANLQNSVPLP